MNITGTNVTGTNVSPQSNNVPVQQSSQDNYENDLRKQISDLQEKAKNIANDKDMSSEQKQKERQAIQEQIQDLNSELRKHQIEKRQEEAEKKQEEIKKAAEDANVSAKEDEEQKERVFGNKELGVIISLSNTKDQITDMKRIRTDLEGRQRTAQTEEEKEELQEKIVNISGGIGEKIKITEDTISDFQNSQKYGADKNQNKTAAKGDIAGENMKIGVNSEEKGNEFMKGNSIQNGKKVFEDITIHFA